MEACVIQVCLPPASPCNPQAMSILTVPMRHFGGSQDLRTHCSPAAYLSGPVPSGVPQGQLSVLLSTALFEGDIGQLCT